MFVTLQIHPGAKLPRVAKVLEQIPKYVMDTTHNSCNITVFNKERIDWWSKEYDLPFEVVGTLTIYPDPGTANAQSFWIYFNEKNNLARQLRSKFPHRRAVKLPGKVQAAKVAAAPKPAKKKASSFESFE